MICKDNILYDLLFTAGPAKTRGIQLHHKFRVSSYLWLKIMWNPLYTQYIMLIPWDEDVLNWNLFCVYYNKDVHTQDQEETNVHHIHLHNYSYYSGPPISWVQDGVAGWHPSIFPFFYFLSSFLSLLHRSIFLAAPAALYLHMGQTDGLSDRLVTAELQKKSQFWPFFLSWGNWPIWDWVTHDSSFRAIDAAMRSHLVR